MQNKQQLVVLQQQQKQLQNRVGEIALKLQLLTPRIDKGECVGVNTILYHVTSKTRRPMMHATSHSTSS